MTRPTGAVRDEVAPYVSHIVLPVQQGGRIAAIDVLRGVTALGILVMTVQLFAMIGAGFSNPYGCAWTDSTNVGVWVALQILFGYKDLLIFGMLFGVGIALVEERGVAASRNATGLHYRRMGVLLLMGLLHAYLIWSGDILYDYALCGSVVFLLRRKSATVQLIAGALAFVVAALILVGVDSILRSVDPQYTAEIYSANFSPSVEQIAAHNATFRSGWWGQMGARMSEALAIQVVLFPLGLFWVCGGSMLVGMGLYRRGMFTLQMATRSYVIFVALAMLVGLPLILYGLQQNFAMNWQAEYSLLRGRVYFLAASPIMALGYVSLIMLICRAGMMTWLTHRLAAVGQMALTTYITQSLICSLLFYGHGFGLVGRVDRVGQLGIVAVVWAVQLFLSPIWLRRFRFGPMEWIWRSLSYGVRQPMRRAIVPKVVVLP